MQTLFYPGYGNEPAQIDYGISTSDAGVNVVAVHSKRLGLPPAASLIARDTSRDWVLNRILERDLAGIRIDQIKFFVLIDSPELGKTLGFEFPIELDFEDYRRKGNPYHVDRSIPDGALRRLGWALGYRARRFYTRDEDVIAGCARLSTPFNRRRGLDLTEVVNLSDLAGHSTVGRNLPKWLKDSVSI